MDIMNFFRAKKPSTASTARDRLICAVAVQRGNDGRGPAQHYDYLPQMQAELLAVIRRYGSFPDDAVQVTRKTEEGLDVEVLEMTITLPEPRL